MTNYREILRLYSQGLSQRSIAASCGCGKGTVQRTLVHAREHGLKWPLDAELTNERLKKLFTDSDASTYPTLPEHMPEDHRKYTQWNAERFHSWARSIGENTQAVVKAIIESRKIEQQGYRACMALLKLADKYTPIRLEAACKKALTYTTSPSFRNVQTILATGQDQLPSDTQQTDTSADYGFTRGPEYYGGDN